MPTRDIEKLSAAVWNKLDLIQNAAEREILGNYRAVLEEIRKELNRVFEKYAKEGILTKAEMTRYNRMASLEKQLLEILGPQLSRNGRVVGRLAAAEYHESFFRHAWALDQSTGVALKWGMLPTGAIEAAAKSDLAALAQTGLRQEAFVGIRRTLIQGLTRGSSYPQMARDFKEFLERSASGYVRVARTEGNRVAVQGQIDNYRAAEDQGIALKRIWVASLDDRTRASHAKLDGKAADENGMFHTEVGLVGGPGMSGVPEFDIQCRCRIRAEVEDMAPKWRRVRDEGIVPYQTYTEWAREHGITRNRYGQEVLG